MIRHWFEEGLEDGNIFRRRATWALAVQWLLQLGTIVLILLIR